MSFNIYLISKNGKNHWVNVDTPLDTITEVDVEPSVMQSWEDTDVLTYDEPRIIHYDRIHGTDCYLERW